MLLMLLEILDLRDKFIYLSFKKIISYSPVKPVCNRNKKQKSNKGSAEIVGQ